MIFPSYRQIKQKLIEQQVQKYKAKINNLSLQVE